MFSNIDSIPKPLLQGAVFSSIGFAVGGIASLPFENVTFFQGSVTGAFVGVATAFLTESVLKYFDLNPTDQSILAGTAVSLLQTCVAFATSPLFGFGFTLQTASSFCALGTTLVICCIIAYSIYQEPEKALEIILDRGAVLPGQFLPFLVLSAISPIAQNFFGLQNIF